MAQREGRPGRIPWQTDSPLTALDIPQKYTSKTLVVLRLTANMGNTAPQNFVSLLRLCYSKLELIEINFYANLNSDRTQLKHFPANPLSTFFPSLFLKLQGHCVQDQNLISSKIEASWRQTKWRRKRKERNSKRVGRMRWRKHAGRGQ